MVTPPMSLPSRGWGDSGGGSSGGSFRSRQHVYPNSGFSCHHAAPTSYTSSSNYSVHDNSRHDGVAEGGGDRGRVGGDSAKGGVGNGAGAPQQQQLRLERFSLSDGFSSAEEETWGSEGEVRMSRGFRGKHRKRYFVKEPCGGKADITVYIIVSAA